MTRNGLYLLLGVACAGGYAYLAWQFQTHEAHSSFSLCPIKNITGIACPSCGSTRSIISIINGDFKEAVLLNPLGFVVAAIMLVVPLWLLYDIAFKKNSLHRVFKDFEHKLKNKWIALPLIALIIANWIWNISKGL